MEKAVSRAERDRSPVAVPVKAASWPLRSGTTCASWAFSKQRQTQNNSVGLGLLCVLGALGLGLVLGWKELHPRLNHVGFGLAERERLYERAHRMAAEYPMFGTGPGTFERVYQLYRDTPDEFWPAQLHNDWLETRLTFGYLGGSLIALAALALLLLCFAPGGVPADGRFTFLVGAALIGCLVEARWDFPLQVYSILFLFLLWCALLSVLGSRPGAAI
jgi:O-antigen ligase